MIQSYLKTGMVFYDTTDKQHFRRDCCKSDFCQFTDKTHFPSYQFEVDGYNGGGFGAIHVFDLNGVDVGIWAVSAPRPTVYHYGDLLCNFNHDYRDEIIYPAFMDYETCYYLRLAVIMADGDPANPKYFYSEAFRVCDCEPEGIGDGEELIENGWFEDWSGAANPNNVPDGWAVQLNDATNYVQDAGGECQIISNNTSDIYIEQTTVEVGKWYVFRVNITAVVAGQLRMSNDGATQGTWNTTGEKSVVFQAVATDIIMRRVGATDIIFTDVRVEEFIGFEFCDRMTLNWWSDCDWDGIIYQDGFRNSLVLADPEKIELQLPQEDIEVSPNERLGELFPNDVIIKKRYRFKIRIPEYLWNALIRLPAYGSEMPNFHCWITLPAPWSSACPMSEVIIKGEWDTGNCFNTFEVEFVDDDEYPVVATNCCDDGDYSEV